MATYNGLVRFDGSRFERQDFHPALDLDTTLLHVSDRLAFITPDAISMSHVVVAAMGAKLIVSESLTQRRIGVVLFEIRYTGEEIFQCLIQSLS